jgi:5-methylcytosine-specific restriction endonuclease McrA
VSPDDTTSKRCRKCGEIKPSGAFNNDKSKKDGLASYCKSCNTEATRARRLANPERERQLRHARLAADPDGIRKLQRERMREWRAANPERQRENDRSRYAANPERERERRRVWIEANKEHALELEREATRKRRLANPDKFRAKEQRRRTLKANGTYTASDLADIRAAQTDKRGRLICWRCGKPIKGTPDLDHWIPLDKSGLNSAGNLHYMHARCNRSKGTKLPAEIGRLI